MTQRLFLIASLLAGLMTNIVSSQTVWQKYEGNPVLAPTTEWEIAGVHVPRVLKINNQYKMWYTALGVHRQIALATSDDGIHWTKSSANPVLSIGSPGAFDSEHIADCVVLLHNNSYWMWYTGYNGEIWQIGLATSHDGVQWTKSLGNPVLTIGSSGAWDANSIYTPVVAFDGHIFKMWYNGAGAIYELAIGYAESNDGIHWTKYANNPILTPTPNTWYSQSVTVNTAVLADGIYQFWFGGRNGPDAVSYIGYATSQDGIHWQLYNGNPVFSPGANGAWDSATLSGCWVLRENNLYKMWYGARRDAIWKIGYATSTQAPIPTSTRVVFLPRVYGLPGDTINVTLYADSLAGISGGDVVMRFDSEVLQALQARKTDFTPDFLIAANLDTPGVARISLAGARGVTGGLGGLVNIRMLVNPSLKIPDSTFSRPLKLTHAVFYSEDGKVIPTKRGNGLFILGRPRGDVNRDGRINSADAILTLRIAAGLVQPRPNQLSEADVDGNGRVESFDASCILYRAVGLDCPAGGESTIAANLVVSPFSAAAGHEIETQISIKGIDKLLSGDVALQYDTNALEILDIHPSAGMSGVAFVTNLDKAGHANFNFASNSYLPSQTVAVLRLLAKIPITEKHLNAITAIFFDHQGQRWNNIVTGIGEDHASKLPAEFHLEQNYPNPFYRQSSPALSTFGSPSIQTQIAYMLPQRAHVKLIIYDLNGRVVRILEDAEKTAGRYAQIWNGTDASGSPVAAGIYLYRLEAGQNVLSRKMLLIE